MLSHGSLSRVSLALGEGFFADKVVKSLRREEPVNSERKAVLERIEEYVSRIEKGRSQVSTGKLSDNAIASISAYSRMLGIVVQMTETADQKSIDKLVKTIRSEVEGALQSKKITPDKLQTTIEFFQYIREGTLQDSASSFGWESVELTKPVGVP
jgi:hypothetical protein